MQPQQCLYCGNMVQYVFVHGHYQCPVCGNNVLPCCDGDNDHTNYFLKPGDKKPKNHTSPPSTEDESV